MYPDANLFLNRSKRFLFPVFVSPQLPTPSSFHIPVATLPHLSAQLVAGQPHPVRGLREKQEVPCDRGGQQASAGGQGGPEAPGPEGH